MTDSEVMKIKEKMGKFANIAKMGSAGQCLYSMRLISKLWKLVHIAKMGPRVTQGQYLIKTIGQM